VSDGTNLIVDGFDPFDVGDGILGVIPMLRVAATQLIDECLQLIAISATRSRLTSECRKGRKTQEYLRGPPELPILLFNPLLHWPTLVFWALDRDVVIYPRPYIVGQLNTSACPSDTHRHLRPLRKEAKSWWEPEMCNERRGQPVGGPSAPSWSGKGERRSGANVNPRGSWIYVGLCRDDFPGVSACHVPRHR
jgi:hypothetical protein